MTAPKQAEAVMTSIPEIVSSLPEKPVAECNPLKKAIFLSVLGSCFRVHTINANSLISCIWMTALDQI